MDVVDSMLTEEEKWRFDLQGFMVLRQVIPSDALKQMLAVLEHWLAIDETQIPAPLVRHRQEPYKTHIDHIQYGHKLFQDLAANEHIIRAVAGLQMNAPRLFHCNFTHMTRGTGEDFDLHRDDSGFKFPSGFRNPHNDYQTAHGQIYCSHLVTWIALSPVPAGTGFTVVPGSHKSAFAAPDSSSGHSDPALAESIPLDPGDCVICATSVLHNAKPWTEDYPRLNIFQRYQLSAYFNETGKEGYPLEEHRDRISAEQYELESLSKETKAVVRRAQKRFSHQQLDDGERSTP